MVDERHALRWKVNNQERIKADVPNLVDVGSKVSKSGIDKFTFCRGDRSQALYFLHTIGLSKVKVDQQLIDDRK